MFFCGPVAGVTPTMRNPKFEQSLKDILAQGKGMIMYCEARTRRCCQIPGRLAARSRQSTCSPSNALQAGGTMVPSANFPTGKSSRSLLACYEVLARGLADSSKVAHLDGGILAYYRADLPIEGEYDLSNAGRTPNSAEPAVIDPKYLNKS